MTCGEVTCLREGGYPEVIQRELRFGFGFGIDDAAGQALLGDLPLVDFFCSRRKQHRQTIHVPPAAAGCAPSIVPVARNRYTKTFFF